MAKTIKSSPTKNEFAPGVYQFPYNVGDIVYLVTDPEQRERMVTGIIIRESATIYYLAHCEIETVHYAIEMSKRCDVIKKTR